MNTHKQIQQITATDELLDQAIALTPSANPKTSTTSNAANNNAPSATT
jgi:hypothetical protein